MIPSSSLGMYHTWIPSSVHYRSRNFILRMFREIFRCFIHIEQEFISYNWSCIQFSLFLNFNRFKHFFCIAQWKVFRIQLCKYSILCKKNTFNTFKKNAFFMRWTFFWHRRKKMLILKKKRNFLKSCIELNSCIIEFVTAVY